MEVVESQVDLIPKDLTPAIVEERVTELRSLFKEEYEENSHLYDKRDYDRFMDTKDDWNAQRWILHQREPLAALKLVKTALKWRKEINLNEMSYEDFPREFYESGCVCDFGVDKGGRRVLYIRCCMFRPEDELETLCNKYFSFIADQCDKRTGSNGLSMVFDLTGAGLSNVSLSSIKFMASLRDRAPMATRQILVVGVPWAMTAIIKASLSFVTARQGLAIRIINLDEITQYIDADRLPLFMGGTSTKKYQIVPIKTKRAHEFSEVSQRIADKLKKFVDETTNSEDFEMVESLEVIR